MPTYICPNCQKELKVEKREDAPHRPFCSHRCKMVDLHKWLSGDYCISEPLERGEDLSEWEDSSDNRPAE